METKNNTWTLFPLSSSSIIAPFLEEELNGNKKQHTQETKNKGPSENLRRSLLYSGLQCTCNRKLPNRKTTRYEFHYQYYYPNTTFIIFFAEPLLIPEQINIYLGWREC